MASKRPWLDIPWHAPSEQPRQIVERSFKRALRWELLSEYLATAASAVFYAPLVALRFAGIDELRRPATSPIAPKDFIGLTVSPDRERENAIRELVAEIGVRRLLVRIPVWHRDRLDEYARFIAGFPGCEMVIAVLQDRGSVTNPKRWQEDLRRIFLRFSDTVSHFQVGHAPNRSKWGCLHFGDYALLMEAAHELRGEFPKLRLIGPALIDFEPPMMLRSLLNWRRYQFDVVGALLYVDRRGAPSNRQFGYFDLARKIDLQVAIASLSWRCTPAGRRRLWITETNWPLAGTGEAAPTSANECVSEEDYATYLRAYYQQAHATGLVERVYWWQLVAAGYGLVDPREGKLRKRSGFEVMRRLLSGEVPLDPYSASLGERRKTR